MGINTEYRIAKYQQIPCQRVNQVGFDGSLAGLIRRVVNTALQRLWSWGQSFFSNPIEVNANSEEIRTLQASIKNVEDSGAQLKGESTSNYLNNLIQGRKDIVLIPNFLADGQSNSTTEEIKVALQTTLKEGLNEGTKFIAIPLIVKGCRGKHITLILVEITGGTIRYFDSFGKPFEHEHNQMNDTSARTIIQQVSNILGLSEAKFKTLHEETQIQFDTHSCGIFVAEYFKLRVIDGLSHEEAMNSLKMNDIESTRDGIGKMLRSALSAIQNTNVSPVQSFVNEVDDF